MTKKPTNPSPAQAAVFDLDAERWGALKGREHIARALEVAAAGGHRILIVVIGAPGDEEIIRLAGQSLYARTLLDTPCPCGNLGSAERTCICTRDETRAHLQGRIASLESATAALHVEAHGVSWEAMTSARHYDTLGAVQARIHGAQTRLDVQAERLGRFDEDGARHELRLDQLLGLLDAAGVSLLKAAYRQLAMSQAQMHTTLLVANTIAALAGADRIGPAHLAEAIQYRPRPMALPAAQGAGVAEALAEIANEVKSLGNAVAAGLSSVETATHDGIADIVGVLKKSVKALDDIDGTLGGIGRAVDSLNGI